MRCTRAGIVHRDLKPGNVMLTDRGPVLIDFGIAQAADDVRVTSAGFVVGTPGYLAPELLADGAPSATTDWWGWAAMLAFAATGRPPFGTRPLEAVIARTRAGDVDLAGLDPDGRGAAAGRPAPRPRTAARRPTTSSRTSTPPRRACLPAPPTQAVTRAATAVLAGPPDAAGAAPALGCSPQDDAPAPCCWPAATAPRGRVAGAPGRGRCAGAGGRRPRRGVGDAGAGAPPGVVPAGTGR